MQDESQALVVDSVRKNFGATVALDDASFSVTRGTVHALLGENGAGKSTMVKMLSGLLRPDAGQISVFGAATRFDGPRSAHAAGIQTAFQELTLVPNLTVAENMYLPYQPVDRFGFLNSRAAVDTAVTSLEKLGLCDIDPRAEVAQLDLPVRQKIEIARAVLRHPRILLLDEPTSALTGRDVEWLGKLIARLKAEGNTIVFVSHRLPEVRAFCDNVTVLRNGRNVGAFPTDTMSDSKVIELIIGRSLKVAFPPKQDHVRRGAPRLGVRDLSAGRVQSTTFTLNVGEILGVAGLQGMGQLDLFRSLFGDLRLLGGTIELDGRPLVLSSPRMAIEMGIGLVPEERKSEALFLRLNGRYNVSIPVIDRFRRGWLISVSRETRAAAAALARVRVAEYALHTPVGAFSGGNQQKVVLAKWLLTGGNVLLLYDPTRGVDVGTKHEIYQMIVTFAQGGGSVLLYSTDLAEVVNLSHRVLVFYNGRVAAELDHSRGEVTEPAIMRAQLGEITPSVSTSTAGNRPVQ